MINLGFAIVPYEALTTLAIATAVFMAVVYIGFEIITTILGIVAVVLSIRSLSYDYDIIIFDYTLGIYQELMLLSIGIILVYRGFDNLSEPRNVNTWK